MTMPIKDYERQFKQMQQEQTLVLRAVLNTFNKNLIISYVKTISSIQDRIKKNIQIYKTEQILNKSNLERVIKLDLHEYELYITQTKIDLLNSSISDTIKDYRLQVKKYNLVANDKQR